MNRTGRDRSTPRSSLSTSDDLGPLDRRLSVASSDAGSIAHSYPSDGSSLTCPSLLPLARGTPVPSARASIYDGLHELSEGFEVPRPFGEGLGGDFPFGDLDVVHQPLELNEVRVKHNATEGLVRKFQQSREIMRPKCRVDMSTWLGLSVWWLVKVRTIGFPEAPRWELTGFPGITQARKVYELAIPGGGRADDPAGRSTNIGRSPLSTSQAYVNLLKSSWILEEEVLAFAGDGENLSREARKFVRDLTEATSPSFTL